MKSSLAFLLLAFNAIAAVCAAPSGGLFFSAAYDDDFTIAEIDNRQGGTLMDRLRGDKRFSQFLKALTQERGLRDELENRDKHTTVFAPTDDAFKKMEDEWKSRHAGEQPHMRDILRYHIVPDADIRGDQMHAGALLRTSLRMKELNDRRQRIRVFRFHGDIWLNMKSRVEQKDMEAENGRIHVIDRVLCLPEDLTEMLYMVPTEFSTFLAAMERTEMTDKLRTEKGMTVFTPSNRAWESLGFDNLRHLFSCAGQKTGGDRAYDGRRDQCEGVRNLKKIMQYHVGTDLAWSTDIMEKKSMRMKTMEGKELCLCAKPRHGHEGGKGSEDCDCGRGRGGRDSYESYDKERHGEHDVRKFNFILNNGEARIQFTDGLAKNGAIHMIDNVLIPDDVKLPHDRM